MAGVQGMASPKQVHPITPQPQAPQGSAIPQPPAQPAQTQELDPELMADLGGSQVQSQSELDPELMADLGIGGNEQPSLGSKIMSDVKDIGSGILTGVEAIGKASMAPFEGAAAEVAKGVSEHPLSIMMAPQMAIKGLAKGIWSPLSQPTLGTSLKQLFPSAGIQSDAVSKDFQIEKNKSGGYDIIPTEDKFKYMSPADALDLASALVLPEVIIRGIAKAPAFAKLVAKGLTPVKESIDAAEVVGKTNSVVDSANAMSANSKVINESLKTLEDINIKIPLTSDAIYKADPYLQTVAKEVNNNKLVQETKLAIGNRIVDAIDKGIPQAIGQVTGEVATTEDMLKILKGQKTKTGKDIGDLKNTAIKNLGNAKLKAPEFQGAFDEIKNSITTPVEGDKLYIADATKREELTKYLKSLEEKLFNNKDGLTAGDWEQIYKDLTKKGRVNYKSETGPVYNSLRTKLSVDQNPMVAKGLEGLNDEAAKMFADGKKNYSDIMKDIPDIKTFISKEGIASESLYNATVKSKSLGAIDKTNSVIDILAIDNPKVAQSFKSGALQSINKDFRVPVTDSNPFGFDGKGWAKEIRRLGEGDKNMLDVLSGGKEQSKALLAMADVAEAFFQSYKGREVALNETLWGRLLYYGKQAKLTNPGTYFQPFMEAADRDKKIGALFKNMDINEVAKAFPPNERKEAVAYITKVMKKK